METRDIRTSTADISLLHFLYLCFGIALIGNWILNEEVSMSNLIGKYFAIYLSVVICIIRMWKVDNFKITLRKIFLKV